MAFDQRCRGFYVIVGPQFTGLLHLILPVITAWRLNFSNAMPLLTLLVRRKLAVSMYNTQATPLIDLKVKQ